MAKVASQASPMACPSHSHPLIELNVGSVMYPGRRPAAHVVPVGQTHLALVSSSHDLPNMHSYDGVAKEKSQVASSLDEAAVVGDSQPGEAL